VLTVTVFRVLLPESLLVGKLEVFKFFLLELA